MVRKLFRNVSLALSLAFFGVALHAAPTTDETVVTAYEAYVAGDAIRFSKAAKKLDGHVLTPWIEYWRISFGLEDASADEVAKYFSRYGASFPAERALAEAARTPKRHIDRLPKTLERRAPREVAVLAAVRLAKVDVDQAATALGGILEERLPERELKYLWGRVAYEGARQHHDQALRWYARAGDTRLDDDQLEWKARAAMRRGRWATVRDAIDRMSAATRQ